MIPTLGEFTIELTVNNITKPTKFVVVNAQNTRENLLGYESLRALDEMVKFDLIELVPAGAKCSWISPLHPVEKPNGHPKPVKVKGVTAQMRANVEKRRIRVTSDNKRLNKAIIRMRRPMPSVSQLQFDLAGNEWFSKVDIRDAFLQVALDADFFNPMGPI